MQTALKLTVGFSSLLTLGIFGLMVGEATDAYTANQLLGKAKPATEKLWKAPDLSELPSDLKAAQEVWYGRDLIAQTAKYFGPKGTLAQQTNGMNCQNCHLDAGTRPFGNNYSAVAATYPKFRERSGTKESIEKRITDCFERSLNGVAPSASSREMKAMVAYIEWLGKEVPKGEKPKGSGLLELPFLDRAADPAKGEKLYAEKCQVCHGANGEGLKEAQSAVYTNPPLWGPASYNIGAGLYRISRFAGYIKANMPFGQATHDKPVLTDEEAWDLAAFVNSKEHPTKDLSKDWPKIAGKPVDHPFGPFVDQYPEIQHKLGPFKPIKQALAAYKKQNPK